MAKTASSAFDQFLGRLTPSDAERDKASTHRASIEAKLEARFGVYKMFESGSFRHGTGVSGFSDVDYFVSLKSTQPALSASILSSVRSALLERFPLTSIHVSRPAVVLEFGGGYERVEVIPAFYQGSENTNDSRYRIPGLTSEWLESTPMAHARYVNDCNLKPTKGAAKSLARLAKAWKYYRDVPISSFYLEMRAAQYVAKQKSVSYPIDLYYFLHGLENAELAAMNDPTGNTGRINPCSSSATLATAKSRLGTAVGRAERAMNAYLKGDIQSAFAEWDQLFNDHFPSYY